MSAYQDYLAAGRAEAIPSLKEFYKDDFHIGAAVAPHWMFRPDCDGALRKHFSYTWKCLQLIKCCSVNIYKLNIFVFMFCLRQIFCCVNILR